ncbi:hypothetical protein PGN35_009415 [Nodosilinea sp. PGN35]|nr:hypothetical protein [Nodosilinea sp. TSF1-S3]MDF0368506.1 hypothetical protein [Nodosilinea sp. TSF1-S3]
MPWATIERSVPGLLSRGQAGAAQLTPDSLQPTDLPAGQYP